MALARALGGLATAACVPVANALICEIFPAERKARSVSVFNVGLFLGGAGGIGLGGLLGFPAALWAAGLPGFALALAVARAPLPAAPAAAPAGQAAAAGARRLLADAAVIARIPTMRWMLLGAIAISFAAGGYLTWFGDFVAAAKGLSIEQATVLLGACALTGGLAGVVSGGVVADRLRTRVASGRLLAISASFAAAVPCALGALYIDAGPGFYAASWLLLFFISWYHAPMAASVDDLVSPARAATAQAAFISTMHLLGTAPSAYLVGWLADRHGLRTALLVPTAAVLLAALAFAGGLRSFARDQAARDRH
jgi:predicted MFS family arabinose efflux permease